MYVTEVKIFLCDYLATLFILATLRQIILETVDGVIMHGNFICKTITRETSLADAPDMTYNAYRQRETEASVSNDFGSSNGL